MNVMYVHVPERVMLNYRNVASLRSNVIVPAYSLVYLDLLRIAISVAQHRQYRAFRRGTVSAKCRSCHRT